PALLLLALLVLIGLLFTCGSVGVLGPCELGLVGIVLDPFTGVLSPLDAFEVFTAFVENCCLSWDVPLFESCVGTGFTFPFRFPSLIPLYFPTPPSPALSAVFPLTFTLFPTPLSSIFYP